MKETDFIKFCEDFISQKEQGNMSIEEVGYAIIQERYHFPKNSLEDDVLIFALDLQTPREMSIGAGINIGDIWTQEIADQYKEKLWQEFVEKVRIAKNG